VELAFGKAGTSRCASPLNFYAYVNGNPLYWSDRLGLKPGDKFSIADLGDAGAMAAAAIDTLDWIYTTYPDADYEYAGTIYNDGAGNYVATDPLTLYLRDQSTPRQPPGGKRVAALYHTHGQCSIDMDNDSFSGPTKQDPRSDKSLADAYQVPSFLETPGGTILRYDFDPRNKQKGLVSQLRGGCPCL
jgi:hypothetical protein